MRFSDKVERQDFEEAMRLMKVSKESVELSAPAKRDVNPLDLVHDIVADLARRLPEGADGWVDLQHVVSMAGHKASDAFSWSLFLLFVCLCNQLTVEFRRHGRQSRRQWAAKQAVMDGNAAEMSGNE